MFRIGAPELVIILIVVAAAAFPVWAIIDAARAPVEAWKAADQSQLLWIALIAGGLVFTCVAGFVFALIYGVAIRPKVMAAAA